jgi:hypothetical protein
MKKLSKHEVAALQLHTEGKPVSIKWWTQKRAILDFMIIFSNLF